jgi:acyl-coenzyme A synthetase/AMP-(fatty) acid ligase
MQGYWNDPERNAATLRGDPRGGNGIAYCTGDRVVLQPDGQYQFRGRRDHMVKIRGYRIELGEVEAALSSHPDVLEAVAVPLDDCAAGMRLVATVLARSGTRPDPESLRNHLRLHVPTYMVPEQIEVLSALPRTSTGKIDRTALRSAWESKGGS